MKAIWYSQYGTPDNLQQKEVPKPLPNPPGKRAGKNEVLVKVHAASINSWDWDLLMGKPFLVRMLGGLFKPKNKILGADIAGVVEAVGETVKEFKPGDEVFAI